MKKTSPSNREVLLDQLTRHGFDDEKVLQAMLAIPRERFVAPEFKSLAWADRALPTAYGQTISQPYMVALMTSALDLRSSYHVLEIGTGSGYQTAILARLAKQVVSVERIPELAMGAIDRLAHLNISNVAIRVGDGRAACEPDETFDRLLITAACPKLPERLLSFLKPDGIAVLPVGPRSEQELLRIRKTLGGRKVDRLGGCVFVPLIGVDAAQSEESFGW